ncbi:MAG: hypothetical protein CVU90_08830 [Firmicutes bacterium HGW-Firmicutes-15]|nr:MAG: hypothetical protein CVU90_08830 [Firmicutes bacterium HGW-Firmicutes-15]
MAARKINTDEPAFKNSDKDVRFEPVVVYGNQIDELDTNGKLITIIPAQPGIYAIFGVFDAIPDEEVLLGYDIPGMSSPDWNEVLNETTYELGYFELPNGEMGRSIMFGYPNIEVMKDKML